MSEAPPPYTPAASSAADSDPDDPDEECLICCDAPCSSRFYPCGHTSACMSCARACHAAGHGCPFCRQPVKEIRAMDARKDLGQALLDAIRASDVDLAKSLLRDGAPTTVVDQEWNAQPLHFACARDLAEIVEFLLQAGADVEFRDKERSSAMHLAAKRGHAELMELLLKTRHDANQADTRGETALHRAAHAGHTEVVKLLLDEGKADLNAVNPKTGQTPLHVAAAANQRGVVRTLLERQPDVKLRDKEGKTAFQPAVPGLRELFLK